MKKKAFLFFAILLTAALLAGCGGKASHWKTYNIANEEFTEITEQYNAYYPMQAEAEKELWREKFDPVFIKGDLALERWRGVLNAGDDPARQETAWNAVKMQVIQILFELSEPKK